MQRFTVCSAAKARSVINNGRKGKLSMKGLAAGLHRATRVNTSATLIEIKELPFMESVCVAVPAHSHQDQWNQEHSTSDSSQPQKRHI